MGWRYIHILSFYFHMWLKLFYIWWYSSLFIRYPGSAYCVSGSMANVPGTKTSKSITKSLTSWGFQLWWQTDWGNWGIQNLRASLSSAISVIAVATLTSIISVLSFKNHQNSRSNELETKIIFKILFNCLEAYFRKETKKFGHSIFY